MLGPTMAGFEPQGISQDEVGIRLVSESSRKGASSEQYAAYRAAQRGYVVSWPLGQPAYDLVVDTGERIYRVQVKTVYRSVLAAERGGLRRGERQYWRVDLVRYKGGYASGKPGKKWRAYTKCDCDYLWAVNVEHGVIYHLPIEDVLAHDKRAVTCYPDGGRQRYKGKGFRIEDYRERWFGQEPEEGSFQRKLL